MTRCRNTGHKIHRNENNRTQNHAANRCKEPGQSRYGPCNHSQDTFHGLSDNYAAFDAATVQNIPAGTVLRICFRALLDDTHSLPDQLLSL